MSYPTPEQLKRLLHYAVDSMTKSPQKWEFSINGGNRNYSKGDISIVTTESDISIRLTGFMVAYYNISTSEYDILYRAIQIHEDHRNKRLKKTISQAFKKAMKSIGIY